jgi:hypothetical protein
MLSSFRVAFAFAPSVGLAQRAISSPRAAFVMTATDKAAKDQSVFDGKAPPA